MKRQLTMDEYLERMDEVATSHCVFVIEKYFDGDVAKFYDAPKKFWDWYRMPDSTERTAGASEALKLIKRYNLVGIDSRHVTLVFGQNYYCTPFMKVARTKLEEDFGYTIVNHGVISYKDTRDGYFKKYLPPKSKIEGIFKDKTTVDMVINPDSYGDRVKKILTVMRRDS